MPSFFDLSINTVQSLSTSNEWTIQWYEMFPHKLCMAPTYNHMLAWPDNRINRSLTNLSWNSTQRSFTILWICVDYILNPNVLSIRIAQFSLKIFFHSSSFRYKNCFGFTSPITILISQIFLI